MLSRFDLRLVVSEEPGVYSGLPHTTSSPPAVEQFIREQIGKAPSEEMLALFLDTRNRVVGHSVVFKGAISRTACEPRKILQMALLCNAAGIIIAHNHPSGDTSPSGADLGFSKRMSEAARIIGLDLIDFLITGPEGDEVWSARRSQML